MVSVTMIMLSIAPLVVYHSTSGQDVAHHTCLSFFGGFYHSGGVEYISKVRDIKEYGAHAGTM